MTLRLAYYGDDFTGSTDALEFLTRAGVRTVLFTGTPTAEQLSRFPAVEAIGVAGFTRALAPAAMERELRPAFAALRALGAPHVHYKVCSTFDSSPTIGSIGCAIDIGAEVFSARFIPLVVGAPPLGRYCAFGNLFARFGIGSAGAIYRLDRHPAMSRHPVTPADEADLRLHLARQTSKRVELIEFLALAKSEPERRAALDAVLAAGAEVVLFDVLEMEHLARIGALLIPLGTRERPLFSVGSSGIEMALGAHWTAESSAKPRTEWAAPTEAKPLLVISGSCSPVTSGQIAWAIRNGFVDVGIDPAAPDASIANAVTHAIAHLRAGRNVIVHSHGPDRKLWEGLDAPTAQRESLEPGHKAPPTAPPQKGSSESRTRQSKHDSRAGAAVSSAALGAALGRIAREVIAATGIKRLLVAGGDTSSYAARALGIEAVEMIAPLAPGAPLCRAYAPGSPADGIDVNFKGGQVGAETYFAAVAAGKL